MAIVVDGASISPYLVVCGILAETLGPPPPICKAMRDI